MSQRGAAGAGETCYPGPAANPAQGTFYWVAVSDRLGSEPDSRKLVIPARTVYRGDVPVFHCEDEECSGQL